MLYEMGRFRYEMAFAQWNRYLTQISQIKQSSHHRCNTLTYFYLMLFLIKLLLILGFAVGTASVLDEDIIVLNSHEVAAAGTNVIPLKVAV